MYSYNPYYEEYLAHYGVLGMKWGIRRYQPYTKGQKGIFKGLKKDYKKQKKVLKAQRKYYQAQGDELAADNINNKIKSLTKAYKASVSEVTKEFNKENWEAYKEKVASTGSMKEVDAIKRELSGEQLWRANERFKAQNEFERTKYGVDEKIMKMNQLAQRVNAGVNIARAGLGVWDIARTIGNMNANDLDYKPLSKEANVTEAAKRVQILKDVKDPTRLPTFSGLRDTSKSYAESYYEKNNKGGKDKGSKEDKSSDKGNNESLKNKLFGDKPDSTKNKLFGDNSDSSNTSKSNMPDSIRKANSNATETNKSSVKSLFSIVKNYEPSESTYNTKISNIVSLSDAKPQNWIPKATNTTSKKTGSWIDKPVTEAVKSLIPKSVDRYQVKGGDSMSKYAYRYSYTKPTSTGSYTTVDPTDEWIKKLQNYSKRED